jgi:pimeloyl-ACP methyl ester carboxylesterase
MRVRYVCFPGLGQNRDIVWPQQTLPFEVIGVDYIAPLRHESLAAYARRFGASLQADGVLAEPARTLLAGVSFGSAIAQEIAAVWPCAGQVMLSGLRSCREIPAPLRLAGRIAPYVPDAFDPLVDVGAAFVIRRFANISREASFRCAAMVRQFPLPWLREHARMAVTWPGCACEVPSLRIHGDRDRVVLARRARDVDVLLKGDRHLSSVARAAEVNAAIVAFAKDVLE